jgi:hypothetical protein
VYLVQRIELLKSTFPFLHPFNSYFNYLTLDLVQVLYLRYDGAMAFEACAVVAAREKSQPNLLLEEVPRTQDSVAHALLQGRRESETGGSQQQQQQQRQGNAQRTKQQAIQEAKQKHGSHMKHEKHRPSQHQHGQQQQQEPGAKKGPPPPLARTRGKQHARSDKGDAPSKA